MSATWPDVAVQTPRRRPWWRRWLRRVVLMLLLAVIGLGFRAYYRHRKVTRALEAALAALDRDEPGWRLKDIEAGRAVVPDGENGALCVVETAKLLPQKWPSEQFERAFTDVPPPEQLDAATFALLCRELDGVRPAVEEARKLATRPDGRHPITYARNVLGTLLKSQTQVRPVAGLLTYDATRQAQVGDMRQALASGRAALNAGRSLGDEPFAVSQLIRMACVVAACRSIERTLSQGEPATEDLAAVQRLLESEAAYPSLLIATRGERALMHELFDALEAGDVPIFDVPRADWSPRSLEAALFSPLARDEFRAEHPLYLSIMARRVAAVRLPPHAQAPTEAAFVAEYDNLPREARLTRLLLTAADKLGANERRRLAQLRCLVAAVAAERYRRGHGAWPASLDNLVPEQLGATPLDPFDGRPLRYRRTEDGVVLYTVGPDGEDDGGALDRKGAAQPGTDLGCRLWDVKHRRQPPRPMEQAPEERGAP